MVVKQRCKYTNIFRLSTNASVGFKWNVKHKRRRNWRALLLRVCSAWNNCVLCMQCTNMVQKFLNTIWFSAEITVASANRKTHIAFLINVFYWIPVPSQPTDFKGEAKSETSILLSWIAPAQTGQENQITGYELVYRKRDDKDEVIIFSTGNQSLLA